jgi:hypothetical protein
MPRLCRSSALPLGTNPQDHSRLGWPAPGGHTDRGLTPGDGVPEVWATREFRYGGEHTASSALEPGSRREDPVKLVTHTFLTLDGVMQGPGGAEEDPSGGVGHGGWLVPFSDADMGVIVESWFARTEAILLGRNTYQVMRAYWSQVTDPANGAATS